MYPPLNTYKQSPGTQVYYQNVLLRLTGISENWPTNPAPGHRRSKTEREKKKKKRWATFSTPKVTELQQSGWSYRQREQSFPGSQVSGTQLPHSDA